MVSELIHAGQLSTTSGSLVLNLPPMLLRDSTEEGKVPTPVVGTDGPPGRGAGV